MDYLPDPLVKNLGDLPLIPVDVCVADLRAI
jgi:hypothetical protein